MRGTTPIWTTPLPIKTIMYNLAWRPWYVFTICCGEWPKRTKFNWFRWGCTMICAWFIRVHHKKRWSWRARYSTGTIWSCRLWCINPMRCVPLSAHRACGSKRLALHKILRACFMPVWVISISSAWPIRLTLIIGLSIRPHARPLRLATSIAVVRISWFWVYPASFLVTIVTPVTIITASVVSWIWVPVPIRNLLNRSQRIDSLVSCSPDYQFHKPLLANKSLSFGTKKSLCLELQKVELP